MGVIRFLLACSVVIAHSHDAKGFLLLPASVSVEAFFIISGFYMALVLEKKYSNDLKAFWLNRWFRIAPTYYLILIASLAIYCIASLWLHHPVDRMNYFIQAFHDRAWPTLSLAILPQITLFGMEAPLLFFFTPGNGLSWLGWETFGSNSILLERFLFVPQTWSVGVELLFYAIVPFLVRLSTQKLVILAIASYTLKIALRALLSGWMLSKYDQVSLPPQLCLFILGMLACRYRVILINSISAKLLPLCYALWLAIFLLFTILPYYPTEPFFLLFTGFLLPVVFEQSRSLAWDQWIGNLSYPIYMCHIAVRWLLLGTHATAYQGCSPWKLLLVTIPASIVLVYILEGPIDRWRHRMFPPRASNLAKSLT